MSPPLRLVCVLAMILVVAGCASAPVLPERAGKSSGAGEAMGVLWGSLNPASAGLASFETDGPPTVVPEGLERIPEPTPRWETVRIGGPNKPYRVGARLYEPFVDDRPLTEQGLASWYGRKYHGRPTASGEVYDMFQLTAAHPTMPLPSYARVSNPANGRSVLVRVNDRGPFVDGRVIDLSYAAAHRIGVLRGVAPVLVERLTQDAIRAAALLSGDFSVRP